MRRFAPYLGIAAALVFYLFAVSIADEISSRHEQAPGASTGFPDLSIAFEDFGAQSTSIGAGNEAGASPFVASEEAVPAEESQPPSATPVSALLSPPAPPPAAPVVDEEGLNAAAATLRSALVNILCYAPAGSAIKSISGSGVFVDSKGIILTNAHIAQYFLLADRRVSCIVRDGDPATDAYKAALIHIPIAWLQANPTVLIQADPAGTGEYDFALLAIIKSANTTPLPDFFPSIPLAIAPPLAKTPVVIATYGAQFLESSQIQSALFPTVVFGSIKDVFTFMRSTIDVIALGGSAAAQEGSSGGGVTNGKGELIGIITTSTTKGTTDTRSLDAITASYIRAAYASETGEPLDLLLSRPTSDSIATFAKKAPELEAIITTHLP